MTNHKKVTHILENQQQTNFLFQQPVSKKEEKFDHFRRNNCLLTKPNSKILHVSATNREKRAIFASFWKHNCVLTSP